MSPIKLLFFEYHMAHFFELSTVFKGEAGCHLDRHESIGKGKIGLEGFKRVMNCPRFTGREESVYYSSHKLLKDTGGFRLGSQQSGARWP